MKRTSLFLVTMGLQLSFLMSCGEDKLVVNVESPNIESLLNATLIDGISGEELNTAKIKSAWERSIFEETGLEVELEKFNILNVEGSDSRYFLKSISKNGQVQTGAFLTKENAGIFKMGTKRCTCSGKCGSGCDLTVTGSMCICSACGSEGDCTKIDSVEIKT